MFCKPPVFRGLQSQRTLGTLVRVSEITQTNQPAQTQFFSLNRPIEGLVVAQGRVGQAGDMSKRCWIPALAVAFSLPTARAAVFPRFSVEDLVARSEVIAQAEVGRSWTAWDNKHKFIWTHYELKIADSIRGDGTTVVVSEPGGKLDGIEQQFDGVLSWTPGARVLVFLYRTPIGYLRTVGGPQGRLNVDADQRVRAHLQNAELTGSGGTPLSAIEGMPVERLKSSLRSLARELPARRSGQ